MVLSYIVSKVIISALLVLILINLATALVHVLQNKADNSAIRALTWRIILSLMTFILLWILMALGYLQPNSPFPV